MTYSQRPLWLPSQPSTFSYQLPRPAAPSGPNPPGRRIREIFAELPPTINSFSPRRGEGQDEGCPSATPPVSAFPFSRFPLRPGLVPRRPVRPGPIPTGLHHPAQGWTPGGLPWETGKQSHNPERKSLQKPAKVVGQASSLSSFFENILQHDRQDACSTSFAEISEGGCTPSPCHKSTNPLPAGKIPVRHALHHPGPQTRDPRPQTRDPIRS